MERTRVFVEATGRRIAPFGDAVERTLILNRPLQEWQANAFAEAGLARSETPEPPCLIVPDTLFASAGALRAFIDGAAGEDAVLVLKESEFGRWTTAVQPGVSQVGEGYVFDAIRFVSGSQRPPRRVVVDPEERVIDLGTTDPYTGGASSKIGLPRHPVMTLHHWVHILWANQVAGASEAWAAPRWKQGARVLGAIVRSHSLNRWRVLAKLSSRGRGCDVHPSALVEGSTLGDGVTVGPNARVLFSRVGDGATVMAGAQVELSVLGERSLVAQNTLVRLCVLYPEATVGLGAQQSVFGRNAVTTGASVLDMNFEQPVRVELDGQLHSSGQHFLGSAFGHRSRLGAGFFLAPGRAVPNDYLLIRSPERVLATLPPDLAEAGPLVADERVLRPLHATPTEFRPEK